MPEIFGKQIPKQTLFIGAGAAGLLGVAMYRYKKQQAATNATAAAAAAAVAPGTGAGSSDGTDPATGFPYGSTEDAAALTSQGQYVDPSMYGGYGAGDLSYAAGGVTYTGSVVPAAGFSSNAQWSQAAEQYMVGNGGDANAIGNALGKYLTGNALTPDQQTLVEQAIAFEGYPPVAGTNGFPPSIQTAQTGTTTPTGTSVAVPAVVGQTLANAIHAIDGAGLKHDGALYAPTKHQVVSAQTPKAGTMVAKGTSVNLTAKG